ncbi:cytochrome P450 [Prescottella sp. R16]|uniref:cytochrome P450 n=1 Tax=Prescottella sp. R16 TaxID=3064529 RepID=UPI00272E55B3|nr:cytochrome P450 [Prescottella sp. R16]
MTTTSDFVPATELGLDEINLADPDFWLRPDIHDALARLRADQPIAWHEHPDSGKGFWSFVDYDDIVAVTRDWQHFSSRYGIRAHHDAGSGQVRPGTGIMIEMDPPEQTANRKHVNAGFTPRQVRKMEDYVRNQAQRIVAEFQPGQEIDFVSDVAARLPMEIICDIMGVRSEDRPYLLDLSNRTLGDQDPEYGVDPMKGTEATLELRAYGVRLAAERLAEPGDDLFSDIARIQVDGKPLPEEQLAGYFALLIAAGNETTRTAITHGMQAFSMFPEQKALFLSDPVGLAQSTAEEIIRWATPIKHMGRVLTEDVEYKGVQMRKGEKVAIWFAAANRDPAIFPEPFQFDITRDPNLHQSFGGGGPHFCLGANLARREVWVLFQELFARFPDARAVSDPRPLRSVQVNGIKELKVKL